MYSLTRLSGRRQGYAGMVDEVLNVNLSNITYAFFIRCLSKSSSQRDFSPEKMITRDIVLI